MVWLKSAQVRYRRPAATALILEFSITEDEIAAAEAALDRDGRYEPLHRVEARDRNGELCAIVETQVHLRLTREVDQQGSAF